MKLARPGWSLFSPRHNRYFRPAPVTSPHRAPLRRAVPTLFALAALSLSFAGCSNNPYPAEDDKLAVAYKTLADDIKTMDPSVAYYVEESTVISNIYPSFYQYHYLKRDPYVLELSLGAEEPKREKFPIRVEETDEKTKQTRKVTKTGERWTFRIKKGLRFQNDPCFAGGKGREITADDFLFAFRRMADPALASPMVSNVDDKILGLTDFEKHQSDIEAKGQKPDWNFPVEGLQRDPNDPYTFYIVMNQPFPQLRYIMAMTFTTPIAHEAANTYGKEMRIHPVGCGPFMLTEYTKKMRMVLSRNPNYREEYYPSEGAPGDREAGLLNDAGKRLPFLDKVVFNIQPEPVTSWNLFLQGYLDAAGIGQTNYQQAMANANELSPEMQRHGIQKFVDPGLNTWFLKFNMEDPVLGGYDEKHQKLRQALSTAMDWQEYIDVFRQGIGKTAQFMIPPGIYGYDPDYKNPYRQYNPEKARQLLAEAGYPDGKDPKTGSKLTLFFDNNGVDAPGRRLTAFIIDQWEKKLGIHIESKPELQPVWQEAIKKGTFQIVYSGWYADYPDPENFAFLLYGPNKRPGPNDCAYKRPEYDKLFEQMRIMDNGPERLALINKMRDMVVEDCPQIYTVNEGTLGLRHSWLLNAKSSPVAYDTPKYQRVDTALRARLRAEWNHPNYTPAIVAAVLLLAGCVPAAQVVNRRRNRYVRRAATSANGTSPTTTRIGAAGGRA